MHNVKAQYYRVFILKDGKFEIADEDDEDDYDDDEETPEFKYEEKLPVGIDSHMNLYEYENFCYTNIKVRIEEKKIFKTENRMLIFY